MAKFQTTMTGTQGTWSATKTKSRVQRGEGGGGGEEERGAEPVTKKVLRASDSLRMARMRSKTVVTDTGRAEASWGGPIMVLSSQRSRALGTRPRRLDHDHGRFEVRSQGLGVRSRWFERSVFLCISSRAVWAWKQICGDCKPWKWWEAFSHSLRLASSMASLFRCLRNCDFSLQYLDLVA